MPSCGRPEPISHRRSPITVTAIPAESGATIAVNGTPVTSGSPSGPVSLSVGSNSITILVTAADGGTTRSYTVVVVRAEVTGTSCVVTPQETDGSYPLYAALTSSALVRSDIREGEAGVPLTLVLTLVDLSSSCDPDGEYSGYSNQANGDHLGETFLRGIQVTDAAGLVTFTTVYPGRYLGRITHIHVEIFLQNKLNAAAKATTQIALPQAVTQAVYASSLYAAHGQNSSVASFAQDNVFSDGEEFQLANVTGDVTTGFSASLTIGVAV